MFQDRQHAGQLLGEKLRAFHDTDAIVVAIPYGGIPVGYQLAKELNLQLEIVPCKQIRHPGCRDKSIGSVGVEEAIVHEELGDDIPHDYISHQITSLQRGLKKQHETLSSDRDVDFKDKTIILVDDRLKTGDTILAGIRSVQKQGPAKVVVAVPVATTSGAEVIRPEANELVCLELFPDPASVSNAFQELNPVDEEEALQLLNKNLKVN